MVDAAQWQKILIQFPLNTPFIISAKCLPVITSLDYLFTIGTYIIVCEIHISRWCISR